MEVTIQNYSILASRTMAELDSLDKNFSHMALGLVDEFFELIQALETFDSQGNTDKINIMEEHGDINWFLAGICTFFDYDYEYLYNLASEKETVEDFKALGKIVNFSKALLAYNKTVSTLFLKVCLVDVLSFLQFIAKAEDFDYLHSLQKNIDKLQTRYPDKFTQENAVNRNIDTERKTLEQ